MMSQVADRPVARCASCRQPLAGPYCSSCGERVLEPEALTVRHFVVQTVLDDVTHLDGKFWRTLRALMWRPAFLTAEYCAGRRRSYIKPVRLLIACILTYAVLTRGGLIVTLTIGWVNLSVAPTTVPADVSVAETVRRIDRFGVLAGRLAARQQAADVTSEAVRERFHARLNQFAEPVSFANVILLSLTLYFLFYRRRPLLVEHGVFSMHLVSFVLLSGLLMIPATRLVDWSHPLGLVMILAVTVWQFAYVTAALRRFYFSGGGRPGSRMLPAATALLIYLLNSAFITIVQMAGAAIALGAI